jgi:hypothetical protein
MEQDIRLYYSIIILIIHGYIPTSYSGVHYLYALQLSSLYMYSIYGLYVHM